MPYASGTGVSGDPYIITNIDHIYEMRNDLNNPNVYHRFDALVDMEPGTLSGGAYYNAGAGFPIMGDGSNTYQGNLDFNGFGFENLNQDTDFISSLFHTCENATIYDGSVHGTLYGRATSGPPRFGLIAQAMNFCNVDNVVSKGLLQSFKGGVCQVGGICGQGNDSIFTNCKNEATIRNLNGGDRHAGIAGRGQNDTVATQFINCLNVGLIDCDTSSSSNNPIVGTSSGSFTDQRCIDCYNDRESSGVSDIDFDGPSANVGVTNLSTVEAQTLASYVNWSIADISTYTNEAWAIEDGAGYPILSWEVVFGISGLISFSANPIADSVVAIMRATNPFDVSTHEVVEFVTADGNGVYTALIGRNPLYDYWASPVGFQSEFTGTISSVTNEFITLPSDLSGISMGGINDQSYYIKGISGPGAGTAFKVISRSGNTIELAVAPAFDNTTTFDLGKAYFPGQPFSKTSLT